MSVTQGGAASSCTQCPESEPISPEGTKEVSDIKKKTELNSGITGMRSLTSATSSPPPDPTLTPHAGDQVGWGGRGGRERRDGDGDE